MRGGAICIGCGPSVGIEVPVGGTVGEVRLVAAARGVEDGRGVDDALGVADGRGVAEGRTVRVGEGSAVGERNRVGEGCGVSVAVAVGSGDNGVRVGVGGAELPMPHAGSASVTASKIHRTLLAFRTAPIVAVDGSGFGTDYESGWSSASMRQAPLERTRP